MFISKYDLEGLKAGIRRNDEVRWELMTRMDRQLDMINQLAALLNKEFKTVPIMLVDKFK